MLWKAVKFIGAVTVDILLDVDDKSEQDKFIDEYNDGTGNIDHYGDSYTEQEARDAHSRGEFYK